MNTRLAPTILHRVRCLEHFTKHLHDVVHMLCTAVGYLVALWALTWLITWPFF